MLWLVRSKARVTLLPVEGESSLFQIAQTKAQKHREWFMSSIMVKAILNQLIFTMFLAL